MTTRVTTTSTAQWLEADAWLASVTQNLQKLSDEELLEAGCMLEADVLGNQADVLDNHINNQLDNPQVNRQITANISPETKLD